MRYAIGRTGEYVDTRITNRRQIEALAPFSCPDCHERVILKEGVKRRLHFAHVHSCGRGESTGHQQDKWNVRQWLQQRGYAVDQEVTVGGRRADLVASNDTETLIVEVQASPLDAETYWQRTAHYTGAGFQVVWLASGMRPDPVPAFSPWMRAELARKHALFVPAGRQLYRFVGCPTSLRRGQGNWVPVDNFNASPFEPYYRFDAHRWTQRVRRSRVTPPYPTAVYRRLVLERLYPLGMLPSLLPTCCYLPLPALWGIHIHPFDFQVVLYLNRRSFPNDSVKWSIEKTCLQFGVTPTSDFLEVFEVQWKQLLNVFDVSPDVKEWPVPRTLEAALQSDVRLFQGFQRFMAKSYTN
ncbi:competence protein CoiA [Exiguobacterium aurantiacum]|uniref:Competence protein n=1 Tax=Exiguobacterium aurantiacum TaxID=33987 RepID=A0A377FV13_9BACL|nr:competence protein CoiA family protein [Exiguobacterium aurantiacum]STO08639.1 Competence protein [Exiguobacterium aurantiacum]